MRVLVVWTVALSMLSGLPAPARARSAQPPFGAAVRVDDDARPAQARNAAVAVDGHGNSVAVWQSNGVIHGSRRSLAGTWSDPVTLLATAVTGPDVVALRDDGTAYLDVGTSAPDGDALVQWKADDTVSDLGVAGQYAHARAQVDLDGDLVAWTESPNGSTTYHFSVAGSDPVADGWTSTTTLRAFGSSRVAFGAGHSYYVAFPPDATGTGRPYRVSLVDGATGDARPVLRHRLCARGSRAAGYDLGAAASGAGVLAWRCVSRSADVVDVQRISRSADPGPVREIARSHRDGVRGRLSDPVVAAAPAAPSVVLTRAVSATARDLLVTSPLSWTRWRRPRVLAGHVAARSAFALGLQAAVAATGAALLSYRSHGLDGPTWTVRRLPGEAFGAPARVFPGPSVARRCAIGAGGAALVARVPGQPRLLARYAAGPP